MIIKTIENGMISVLTDGVIQWRQDTVIYEDNIELSRSYNRTSLTPSSDTSNITDSVVKAIADLIWTPEVVAKYEAKMASIPPLSL